MFDELLRLRNETFETPSNFELITPEKQLQFNTIFKQLVSDTRPVILPQDDDADGFVCVQLLYEVINYINPNKVIDIYIPKEKSHGVDNAFVDYIMSKKYNDAYIIITDSSTDCIDVISQLSKFSTVLHLDHHVSETEDILNNICVYHANCRYETDNRFHNLSAGFYVYLHLANYCLYNTRLTPSKLPELYTLATLSLVADVCSLKTAYNRSIVKTYMNTTYQHVLLQCFTDRFTRYDIYFLAFKVAPIINMLFRLRYIDYIKELTYTNDKQSIVDNIKIIYKNYKAAVDQSINFLHISDYGKFLMADITHLNDIYPMFEGKIVNFTGWYANNLSSKFAKPCIIMCKEFDTDKFKCSIRDSTEQDVYSILMNFDYLEGGGHKSAVGFTVDYNHICNLISDFYYAYPDIKEVTTNTVTLENIYELEHLIRHGDLTRFCEYNDYTLNSKLGFLYKVKHSDVIERSEKICKLKNSHIKIICFENTLQSGDTVKLIPDMQNSGIQLLAYIVERSN